MSESATEFTSAWNDFEERLGVYLADLSKPTLHATLSIHAPSTTGVPRIIEVEGRSFDSADGVDVRIARQVSQFFAADHDAGTMPDAARYICAQLRDEWNVAHPSLLSGEGGAFGVEAAVLGLPAPERVLDDDAAHDGIRILQRRVARREPRGGAQGEPVPYDEEMLIPFMVDTAREALEATLARRFGSADRDSDGDYRVEVDGVRFYVTLDESQPVIRIWKWVVSTVLSRTAATVEANYLNRIHPMTRWVLWGHSLVQEIWVPTAPAVPGMLDEMLDRFAEQYSANISSLRLRLEGE